MTRCVVCGNESSVCLCDECKSKADLEKLCGEIALYQPGSGKNLLWDDIAQELSSPYHFKNLVFALSSDLDTPRKEYWQVMSISGSSSNVPKASRPWFYDIYHTIVNNPGLSEAERNRLHGIALGAYYMDYAYQEADEIAAELYASNEIPWQGYFNLAEFYTTTRRYELADEVIADCLQRYSEDAFVVQTMKNQSEKNAKQREKAIAGKQEYLPNPKENRDEARKKYIDFLSSVGIEATVPAPANRARTVIPRDQYPAPIETRDTDFDQFVAFDIETTGRSSKTDSIIEIGAIKVVGDRIVESERFTFQELVQPLDYKKVSPEIEALTGITNAEAYAARPVWEVLPEFMNFVGDSVLLGFNCIIFDSRFMVRAGRYSNIVIENKYFDVMRFADSFKEKLGIDAKKASLQELADKLGIENPHAHRALADAITTAKVFLRLKELKGQDQPASIDDLLGDLDNW